MKETRGWVHRSVGSSTWSSSKDTLVWILSTYLKKASMVIYFWNSNIERGDWWVLRVHQPTVVIKIVSFQFSQTPCLKAIRQGSIEEDTQGPDLDPYLFMCKQPTYMHAHAWAHTCIHTHMHTHAIHTHTQYKPRCWEIRPYYEMIWLPWQMSVPSMMSPCNMAASLRGVWETELETFPHKCDYTNVIAAFLLAPTYPPADEQAAWFFQ